MPLLEVIFSDKLRLRKQRHLICWLLWWLYVVLILFAAKKGNEIGFSHFQPGLAQLGYVKSIELVLIKSFLLVLTHVLFCYMIIYVLLPNFLFQKKYLLFITSLFLVAIVNISVAYFLYSIVHPFIDKIFSLNVAANKILVWVSIDAGLINAIKLTSVAAAFAFLKRWWLKQKEKEKLEKEKISTELQLLKAHIHPAFLFNTLNAITLHAKTSSPQAPEMLIKLSDLLSYMLYECDAEKVNLEKEISMLKEYVELEKMRQVNKLEITLQVNGSCTNQVISPLLLLPFIDNSFSYSDNETMEQAWVNLDITIDSNKLSMKLINGLPTSIMPEKINYEQPLIDVQKRLQLLYPNRHELKINAEQELLMVHLKLTLEEAIQEDITINQTIVETTEPALSYGGI